MSNLEGKIRFNAARFRELAKMSTEEAEGYGNFYSHYNRGKAQAFKLAASQTDSLLTDGYADFLDAEEKKCMLESLLEKVRAEILEDDLDEHRVDSYTAGRVGGLSMVCEWIEETLSEEGE